MKVVFSALLLYLCSAKASDEGGTPFSATEKCFNVGSLKGVLTFINSVTQSLGEVAKFAKTKADLIEDAFCGNEKMNRNASDEDLKCIKAVPDCAALYSAGLRKSGVYRIWPKFYDNSFLVYCDMATDGGGWTVIQRRGGYSDPPRSFDETWENYKKGFGNIEEDFWLGNDLIFALTNQAATTLRIELKDFNNEKRFAKYKNFVVRSGVEKYRMTIGDYEGNAGDSLKPHNDQIFVTKGQGNSCPDTFKSGWWFIKCYQANLNGLYHSEGHHDSKTGGINWHKFRAYNHSMKHAEMKIRPCDC